MDKPEWAERAKAKLESLRGPEPPRLCDAAPSEVVMHVATVVLQDLIAQGTKPRRIAPIADGGIVFVLDDKHVIIPNDAEMYVINKEVK